MLNITDLKEMQTKTTMRYHLTPISRQSCLLSKRQEISAGEGVEKRKPSYTVGGNVNCCSCCGKQYGGSSKKLKLELPYDPETPFLVIHPDEIGSRKMYVSPSSLQHYSQ